jgi:hypothetical protein
MNAPGRRIAGVGGADIVVIAVDRIVFASLEGDAVVSRARVAVTAVHRGAAGPVRTGISRGAASEVEAGRCIVGMQTIACCSLAGIIGAGIAVIAVLGGVDAGACCRVAGVNSADKSVIAIRLRPGADPAYTFVARGAGIFVCTDASFINRGIDALDRGGITNPGHTGAVILVQRSAVYAVARGHFHKIEVAIEACERAIYHGGAGETVSIPVDRHKVPYFCGAIAVAIAGSRSALFAIVATCIETPGDCSLLPYIQDINVGVPIPIKEHMAGKLLRTDRKGIALSIAAARITGFAVCIDRIRTTGAINHHIVGAPGWTKESLVGFYCGRPNPAS